MLQRSTTAHNLIEHLCFVQYIVLSCFSEQNEIPMTCHLTINKSKIVCIAKKGEKTELIEPIKISVDLLFNSDVIQIINQLFLILYLFKDCQLTSNEQYFFNYDVPPMNTPNKLLLIHSSS